MTHVVSDGLNTVRAAGQKVREGAGAADREAVCAAEQTVGDAWIGRLLLIESETEAIAGACARTRERAADRVRDAQRAGDLAALARSQSDLETADTAWGHALKAHRHARTRLSRELAAWSQSTTHRVRQALSDQPGALRR
jgi:hypothetical protein